MKLSSDQEKAVSELRRFLMSDDKIHRLQGAAGCGKSTVISQVLGDRDDVTYTAPTAKAASVLRGKGVDAVTLHSLMYQPVEVRDEKTGKPKLAFKENPRSPLQGGGIVVVDEASMCPGFIAAKLMEYPIKVIAVGDPFQLPPVKSSGSLLTGKPDSLLTQVHRTALDSPVLELATYVRERGQLPRVFERGQTRVVDSVNDAGDLTGYDVTLVGKHVTRHKANDHIRQLKGRSSRLPEPGEKVLAKRNDLEKGLINGCLYEVKKVLTEPGDMLYTELMDDEGLRIPTTAWSWGFVPEGLDKLEEMGFKDRAENAELWHGEAITTHSSQGSEFPRILVVDESRTFRAYKSQWLYTAVTRASESVTVVRK